MEWFFAGLIAGVLIEHFHALEFGHNSLIANECIKPEVLMNDVLFVGLTLAAFGMMTLAVRILQR